MRTLSSTLVAAQRRDSVVPAVKVVARKHVAGALRLDWERLYSGSEPAGPHAAAMPGDGSLVRVRVSPAGSGQALLLQRVASPGPGSAFDQWTDTGRYGTLAVAVCSLGSEISLFWIDTFRKLQRFRSTDCGVTWDSPEMLDYAPSTNVSGLAAAYRPDGGLAVFFTDQNALYIKRNDGGVWQDIAAWNGTTGDLSGVACSYGTDRDLLVTGSDASGNHRLWGLVYGDGGEIPSGTWSELKEVAAAPAGEDFSYGSPFLDRTDVVRCFFVENYAGTASYARPFHSYMLPGGGFAGNLWREPVPFDYEGGCGVCPVHYGDYAWLSAPDAVWRAPLADEVCDMSPDILGLKEDLSETSGKIVIELRNDDGRYAAPVRQPALDTGCRIEFSPGCRTSAGTENSEGPAFFVASLEYITAPGRSSLLVTATGGWEALQNWTAPRQFCWNKDGTEFSVRQILEFVLARAGLGLQVVSASSVSGDFYPDFTVHPGNSGDAVVKRLLSFIPDVLFFEGDGGYLVDPLPDDAPVYDYGAGHVIREGRYGYGTADISRVEVEGLDAATGSPLLAGVFDWEQVARYCGRTGRVSDANLGSIEQAVSCGDACLRYAEMRAFRGLVRGPVNCGQQLYDVVAVTDLLAGLSAVPLRVLGISVIYDPAKGEYGQQLELGNRG